MFGVTRFSASIHNFNWWVFRLLPWFRASRCLRRSRKKAILCVIGMNFSAFLANPKARGALEVFHIAKLRYFLIARFGSLHIVRFKCLIGCRCDYRVKQCVRWWVFWHCLGYDWCWMRDSSKEWTRLRWFVQGKIGLGDGLTSGQDSFRWLFGCL
jgi:hypothetical protein